MLIRDICKGVRYLHKTTFYEVVEPWIKIMVGEGKEWIDGVAYRQVGESGTLVGDPYVRDRETFKLLFKDL